MESQALLERLVRVETKLDTTLNGFKRTTETRLDDHENRLRRVERVLVVLATLAAMLGGAAGNVLVRFLGG